MFYNIHTHQSSNQKDVFDIVNQYPNELDRFVKAYSIGIHPWYITENRIEGDLMIIEQRLSDINCFALGECGLDKAIGISLQLQIEIFQKQLILAERYNKPIIIHCVKAFQEVIAIRKKNKISVPMIIHGFSKNSTIAKQLIDNGFYLSFGKYFLRNPKSEKIFQSIPEDRIFLETDTIQQTIQEVYALAAKYLNEDLIMVKKRIANNFKTIFKNGGMD